MRESKYETCIYSATASEKEEQKNEAKVLVQKCLCTHFAELPFTSGATHVTAHARTKSIVFVRRILPSFRKWYIHTCKIATSFSRHPGNCHLPLAISYAGASQVSTHERHEFAYFTNPILTHSIAIRLPASTDYLFLRVTGQCLRF